MAEQSPSQTVGPFFHIGLIRPGENLNAMVGDRTQGQRILVRGRVLDGTGMPVPDALVEAWQADAQGIYPHPNDPRHAQADPHFGGFGRAATDPRGEFTFNTIKPGPIARPGSPTMAPHLNLRVFARGMLIHANTRAYFPDEPANDDDPVLSMVDGRRRHTLIAVHEPGEGLPTYRFDIVLQGEKETVFFDL
jgi:protocatechuate 3,4-dioxygenase alpha subunit